LAINAEDLPDDNKLLSDLVDAKCQAQGRHQISRVVVLHNHKLETFITKEEAAKPASTSIGHPPDSDDFFDSDSFWSGSITWY